MLQVWWKIPFMHLVIFIKPFVEYISMTPILDMRILKASHLPSVTHLGSGAFRIQIKATFDFVYHFLTYTLESSE